MSPFRQRSLPRRFACDAKTRYNGRFCERRASYASGRCAHVANTGSRCRGPQPRVPTLHSRSDRGSRRRPEFRRVHAARALRTGSRLLHGRQPQIRPRGRFCNRAGGVVVVRLRAGAANRADDPRSRRSGRSGSRRRQRQACRGRADAPRIARRIAGALPDSRGLTRSRRAAARLSDVEGAGARGKSRLARELADRIPRRRGRQRSPRRTARRALRLAPRYLLPAMRRARRRAVPVQRAPGTGAARRRTRGASRRVWRRLA